MSLGGYLDRSSAGARVVADFPYSTTAAVAAMSQPRLLSPSLPNSIFSSPGLSLALQTNLGGGAVQGEMMGRIGMGDFDNIGAGGGRNSREEYESRSGSDNVEGGSGDDHDAEEPPPKKRYHRHTPHQIQELEAFFKGCPHPDEKQRLELSKRLGLETRQVKFWFQNRRTQMKTQLERHDNTVLRQDNDKLRAENLAMRDAMRSPVCTNCGGPALLGEVSAEHQHLMFENASLREELHRVCALAGRFLGRPNPTAMTTGGGGGLPPPFMPNSSLELAIGGNGFPGYGAMSPVLSSTLPVMGNFLSGVIPTAHLPVVPPPPAMAGGGLDGPLERSMLLEMALSAMDELARMAQVDEPLWGPPRSAEGGGGKEVLNYEEYLHAFPRCIGPKPTGFVTEATRETGVVVINSLALVETLMDADRWANMFPCMIARASTTDVISNGMGGTRNGSLQLMHAELQVLSPLVPIREVNFLRFCKQHAEGVWAVVDVSVDAIRENPSPPAAAASYLSCRRLPSGCVVQDMPNGCSKVTWVEHAEYDETAVHHLYRPLLRSGLGLGAQRWVATLQRQCESLALLVSSTLPSSRDHAAAGITAAGRRSMLKLAQRMTGNFCAGVCASAAAHGRWSRLRAGAALGEDVRVMTRNSEGNPGEPPGVVLSAATSVWLPGVTLRRVFDFLRDASLRGEWDILSNGGPMQEMARIPKGHDPANAVSLLCSGEMVGVNQSSMLILQETCTDASGSLVVYAPVDVPAMHLVMNGGDSTYVALLPSGFAIVPAPQPPTTATDGGEDGAGAAGDLPSPQRAGAGGRGCLLTVAFQILVNSLPNAKLTVESVETVNSLISCTVQKIKASLHCEN